MEKLYQILSVEFVVIYRLMFTRQIAGTFFVTRVSRQVMMMSKRSILLNLRFHDIVDVKYVLSLRETFAL